MLKIMPKEDTQFPKQQINKRGRGKVCQHWMEILEIAKEGNHYRKAYDFLVKEAFENKKQWALKIFLDKLMPNIAIEEPVAINLPSKLENGKIDEYLEILTTGFSKFKHYSKDDLFKTLNSLTKLKDVSLVEDDTEEKIKALSDEQLSKIKNIIDENK